MSSSVTFTRYTRGTHSRCYYRLSHWSLTQEPLTEYLHKPHAQHKHTANVFNLTNFFPNWLLKCWFFYKYYIYTMSAVIRKNFRTIFFWSQHPSWKHAYNIHKHLESISLGYQFELITFTMGKENLQLDNI